MLKWLRHHPLEFVILIALLCVGLGLRAHQYWSFPLYGETQDEYAWTWLGSSLLATGQPTSWSYFGAYQDHHFTPPQPLEISAPLVRPALDHPPLFSLLPGAAHLLKNQWFTFPTVKMIRLPMLVLGVVNLCLFYGLARKAFNHFGWASVATVLFATIPGLVFASRVVVAENLLATWVLAVLLIVAYREKLPRPMLWLIGISVAAVMTKISGLAIPLSLIGLGWWTREKYMWRGGIFGLAAGVATLISYVSLYNLPLFLAVQAEQSQRDVGLATLINRWWLNPVIVRDRFVDGWFIGGMLSFFVLISQELKKLPLIWKSSVVLGISLIGFNLLTAGETTFHGWYDYPLWPIWVLSLAFAARYIWEKQHWLLSGLLWLFMLPILRSLLSYLNLYPDIPSLVLRLIMLLGFLPFGMQLLGLPKVSKYVQAALWIGLVVVNCLTVLTITQTGHWELQHFFAPWQQFH